MSAAGRLSTLGLAFALCLMSSTTSDPPRVPQQQGQGLNVSSPGRWLPAKPPELASSFVEPTVVTLTDRPVKLPVALGQPLVPRGRNTIGHQLQEELRRVGCYRGELNGVWATSTRRAMQEFLERVNAVLPIDQPDGILLALVQGHQGKVCGAPCPAGQGLSRDTQCVPNAILAMTGSSKSAATTNKKFTTTTSAWTVQTTLAGQSPATEPPGDVSGVATVAATAPEPPRRRVAEKHWLSPSVKRERNWASALFRSSVN